MMEHHNGAGAMSLDGRTFAGHLSLDTPILTGDLVLVRSPAMTLLGQVLDKRADGDAVAVEGALLARVDEGPQLRMFLPTPFSGAALEAVTADVFSAHQASVRADLPVASVRVVEQENPAMLRSKGFSRHTFLCGQSGSGKTYALGVILERLLLHTGLRMVVVDPNADYVRLAEQRPDLDEQTASRLRAVSVRVLRAAAPGQPAPAVGGMATDPLCVAFPELSPAAKAAVFQLDPLKDRDEYSILLGYVERLRAGEVIDLAAEFEASTTPAEVALGQRMRNLGVGDWNLWSRGRAPIGEFLDARARATVLDLSGFATAGERSTATVALLDYLWGRREERTPTLVVIDEAHNVCSADPQDQIQALATQRLVQIAGEGRKYGIWLLLSTQRPSKIHPNVVSQCDNLALMRMNSPADLAELAAVFGFAPASMLAMSPFFRQGEVLFAGLFSPAPTVARMSRRYTLEGGSDVPFPAAL